MNKSIVIALAINTVSHAFVNVTVEADLGTKAIFPYISGSSMVISSSETPVTNVQRDFSLYSSFR